MTMRTNRKTVTFRRPFSLSGMDEVQPAGTYTVETNEELIESLSFPAWRRTATVILLRPQAGVAGLGHDLDIDPLELEAVQESDAVNLPDAVVEASLGELLADGVLGVDPYLQQPLRTLEKAQQDRNRPQRLAADAEAKAQQPG
jgi:hypothetical protein